MARTKSLTGSGRLHRNKLPVRVLECVCSWKMAPRDLAEELHVPREHIWRAVCNLRRCGYVVYNKPSTWNKIIEPTRKGRAALEAYTLRIRNAAK